MEKGLVPQDGQELHRMIEAAATSLGLENIKTTTDQAKKTATISGDKDGYRYRLAMDGGGSCEIKTASQMAIPSKKSDLKDEVKRLHNDRYKQREIADMLGISQSLVSSLLNG